MPNNEDEQIKKPKFSKKPRKKAVKALKNESRLTDPKSKKADIGFTGPPRKPGDIGKNRLFKNEVIKRIEITDPRRFESAQVILDPRLGRRYEPDARSARFPISGLLPRMTYEQPRSKIWPCKVVLDQGSEGSCVGHGFAHDLIAAPFPLTTIALPDAKRIYKAAQDIDEWPGNLYEGTSVIAGAKAVMNLFWNAMESYRWATTIQDVIATLGYHGPVVVGFNWYTGMYNIDSLGYIRVYGTIAGGHCLLVRGVDVENARFLLHNSWGPTWGKNGTAWMTFEDFERLMTENGDVCVPINRKYWKKVGHIS